GATGTDAGRTGGCGAAGVDLPASAPSARTASAAGSALGPGAGTRTGRSGTIAAWTSHRAGSGDSAAAVELDDVIAVVV
ncbi:hypothetical protein, partial [Pseudonocardia sp. N23]|uniref:hypothetical protein n=1 Tax=Pseudonocardia sp. N23 TaxID=1987376 RepID=UPI00209C3240